MKLGLSTLDHPRHAALHRKLRLGAERTGLLHRVGGGLEGRLHTFGCDLQPGKAALIGTQMGNVGVVAGSIVTLIMTCLYSNWLITQLPLILTKN